MATSNKCLVLTGYGGMDKFQIQHGQIADPAQGQVRIRVEACGINFTDLMTRQGTHGINSKLPCVLGYEVAGVIDAIGEEVNELTIGARVIGICPNYNGWSSFINLEANLVFPMNDYMTFEEAAALPMNYITAYVLLFNIGNLKAGQSVLCHAAAGGVGFAVGQLCKTVSNVTLYGTCSKSKHEAAGANGYSHLIDYRSQDYVKEISKLAPEGLDLVLDSLGGNESKRNYELTAVFGKHIMFGSSTSVQGENRSLIKMAKMWWSNFSRTQQQLMSDGKTVGGVDIALLLRNNRRNFLSHAMEDILQWYTEGIIRPKIDSVHALEDFAEAFRQLIQRKNVGKVLISPTKAPVVNVPPSPTSKSVTATKGDAVTTENALEENDIDKIIKDDEMTLEVKDEENDN